MDRSDIRASELLDSLQIGVVVHSCDTTVQYGNPKALELLRLTKNQILGMTASDPQWRFLDKDGKELPVEDYPVNQVVRQKAALKDFQAGIRDGSDKITWVNCNAYPEFGEDGAIDRIIVNFIDITEQKRAIPYRDIVELSNDAILVTDANTDQKPGPRIIYANRAFYEFTGYSEEEVIGNTPHMLHGDHTDPGACEKIDDAVARKVPVRLTLLNYLKDGTSYWNEVSIFPLKNKYGEVTHYVGIERDVSARKKREEEVNTANRRLHNRNLELKEINEQKNRILGIVAHDLRNPLYALTTSFELLNEIIDQNDPELLNIIECSLNNMNAIIEDLIESQKLEMAEISATKDKHLIPELIHEVKSLNVQNARKKDIVIHTEIATEGTLHCDYGKLHRALDNLLSNAIKFSPHGSEVTIGCEPVDSDMLRIYVHDNGPGLTDDDKSKVFAPFQRLSAQPTADEGSTGLGLSIVKKIAQLHGGDAGVISEYLKGSKFYLDLPR